MPRRDSSDPSAAYSIVPARPRDLAHLPRIELEAATMLADWNVPPSDLFYSTSVADFRAAQEADLLWVALSAQGEPVGFAQVEIVDGQPHLEEIDVLPSHGRRGIGRALIARLCSWARAAGYTSITLTTYRDIPWNEPFYARLGFRVLDPAELTPELQTVVQDEEARGLERGRRVVMRYDLGQV